MALEAVTAIGLTIGAEWVFVRVTGALQAPRAARLRPAVAAGDHDLLVTAMLLGSMVALVSSIAVTDATWRGRLVSLLLIPVPLVASLAFGLALGGHRAVVLTSFAVLLGLGGLARRWGSRGAATGIPLFIGDFIGFFLHGTVRFGAFGWLVAEVAIGTATCILVQLALFRPDPAGALRRSQRSWAARARAVARAARSRFELGLAEDPGRPDRRLQRALTRLNESSLIIDAQLAEPGAAPPGSSARGLHDRLFEAELGVDNMARFATALAGAQLRAETRQRVLDALVAVEQGEPERASAAGHALLDRLAATALDLQDADPDGDLRRRRILLHRFATSVALVGDALGDWLRLGDRSGSEEFSAATRLVGGWLPGSAEVSNTASTRRGARWQEGLTLPRYVRTAIQMALAVGVATAVGDAFDPPRFYWAVIAVFVSFTGTNTSFEQVRKAVLRVAGTFLGILVGSVIAFRVGTGVWPDVVVILVSLFAGLYLFRVNYGFFVVGLTVMLTMLYEQLGEYSAALLVQRLEETAIGAAVAAAVSLVVLPLHTTTVLDVAVDEQLAAVGDAVRHAAAALVGDPGMSEGGIADAVRRVDAGFQAIVSTAAPLRYLGASGRAAQRIVVAAGALRHYTRNLAHDVPAAGRQEGQAAAIRAAAARSEAGVAVVVDGDRARPYVRAASEWNLVEQVALDRLRRCVAGEGGLAGDVVAAALAARDFQLVDAAVAVVASVRGHQVLGLETDVPRGSIGAAGAGWPAPATG